MTRLKAAGTALLISIAAASCLALPEPRSSGPPIPTPVSDAAAFIQSLRDIGLEVAETGTPTNLSSENPGTVLRIDHETIQIFQFETTEKRKEAADSIAPDAFSVAGQPVEWTAEPKIWSSGRLIVTYDGLDGGVIQVISGVLGDPITIQLSTSDEPYPPALLMTMQVLALDLEVDPATIDVISFEPTEWEDTCLGLPREGEVCEQRASSGWSIHLRVAANDYRFHTDELGLDIRSGGLEG
jgi:hypothetical protein